MMRALALEHLCRAWAFPGMDAAEPTAERMAEGTEVKGMGRAAWKLGMASCAMLHPF